MQKPIRKRGIRRLAPIGVVIWVAGLAIQAAPAGDLQGGQDPALEQAIELWLRDNDADSLPVFAALASDGNKAARILLARIEETDRASSRFVGNLSRKQRMELFRSTSGKGLFRPSWLKSETGAGNRIAEALLQASALEVDIEAIERLYEIGEVEAAYDLIRQVAGNGNAQEKARLAGFLPPSSELAPYLRALQAPVEGVTPGLTALRQMVGEAGVEPPEESLSSARPDTVAAAAFVEWGYQTGIQAIDFDRDNAYYESLANWIEAATAAAPIATFCNRSCQGEAVRACELTAFGLAGGYYKVIRFDSPVESLIEQSRYASSERAAGMLLRRISTIKNASGSGTLASSDAIRDQSACLVNAVEAHTGS